MKKYICYSCKNKTNHPVHGAPYGKCLCKTYDKFVELIEDTTKLYDKTGLCPCFSPRDNRDKIKCGNKVVYSYRYDAVAEAYRIFNKTHRVLMPYKCRICGKWHLTHKVVKGYSPVEEYNYRRKKLKLYD